MKFTAIILGTILTFTILFATAKSALTYVDPKEIDQDRLMLIASDCFLNGDLIGAKDAFATLYAANKSPAYAQYLALIYTRLDDISTAASYATAYMKSTNDYANAEMNKIMADYYIKSRQYQNALKAVLIVKRTENSDLVNGVLASIYMELGDYAKALAVLKPLYAATASEETLEKLISIELKNKNTPMIKAYLVNHIKKFGCSPSFCDKSVQVFTDLGDRAALYEIISAIYIRDKSPKTARMLIEYLVADKQYSAAIKIAAKYPKQDWILQIYTLAGDFTNASNMAYKFYQSTKNPTYLALSQIYKYQSLNKSQRQNKPTAATIATTLEDAVLQIESRLINPRTGEKLDQQDAFIYNFLAFLLIDHDLNVLKGINYARRAIDIAPEPEYIDTIAWGYFKLSDCASAMQWFAKIPKEIVNKNKELKAHFTAITRRCAKPR